MNNLHGLINVEQFGHIGLGVGFPEILSKEQHQQVLHEAELDVVALTCGEAKIPNPAVENGRVRKTNDKIKHQ